MDVVIKQYLTWEQFFLLLKPIQKQIAKHDILYGIPKGGLIVTNFLNCNKTVNPKEATIIIDDIVDSGRTKKKYIKKYPKAKFITVIDKQTHSKYAGYIVFPWEKADNDAQDVITKVIEFIGDNPVREGLVKTPNRVVKSWQELYGGYNQDPEKVLKTTFQVDCDEMVICKDIEFYSTCEHHMLPFFGKCHIGYIPKSQVVGLSKLARLLEVYSRRLQIQEQLTNQVANSLMDVLKPIGVGVIIEAKHFCMMCRGVNKRNSTMITSAIRGIFQNSTVKNEFHRLVK
jgi:GTP cyclohydrolase I|tara:strand:+ start:264 stop:1121 length:858 start_codon:yes stop_codon:yes gene_type:complete